jgi:hypothetical protein
MSGIRKNIQSISLKDLRLAKFGKGRPIRRCSQEFDAYLAAMARVGEKEHLVPIAIATALSDCIGETTVVSNKAGVAYHLSKFVKR